MRIPSPTPLRIPAAAAIVVFVLAACSTSNGAGPTSAPLPTTAARTSGPAATGTSGTTSGATSAPSTPPSKAPTSSAPTEAPVPTESNPPGDIPDSTVFVPYTSQQGHFLIKVPEGWGRTATTSSVAFTDKLNSVEVVWKQASKAPTAASARAVDVKTLQGTERAFRLHSVQVVSLPGGQAVLISYGANSAPNSVTGKQYREDVLRFEFFHSGEEADLVLNSPVGADNVDPWHTVSQSFQWK